MLGNPDNGALRFRTLAVLAALLIVGLVAGATYVGISTEKSFNHISDDWNEYNSNAELKGSLLNKIRADLGYGGFIHAFKNYVLRQDPRLLGLAEEKLSRVKAVLLKYEQLHLTGDERQALSAIRGTVKQYEEKLLIAIEAASQGLKPLEVDKLVKVDDRQALDAMELLALEWVNNHETVTEEIERAIRSGEKTIEIGILMVVLFALAAAILLWFLRMIMRELLTIQKSLVQEIKEHKQAEKELLTTRVQAEKIVEGAGDGIVSVDADQNIIAFNKAAEMIFGYAKDEALGKALDLLLPKDVAEKHADLVQRFGGAMPEARWMGERKGLYGRRKNGELFPAEISISKQDTSTGLIFTAILKDISRRKQAEQALRESEERFRALANYTPNKLHIKDAEGRYILINRKSEELFGVTNEEARGKTAADIFPSEMGEAFDAHNRAVIETGEPVEEEEEFLLDDGVHTYLTVKFPILGADGEIVAVGSSGFEITERKRAEEELIQHRDHLEELVNERTVEVKEKAVQLEDALAREKEYNALQQKFTSLVGHELRTPLSIIDGVAQRLIRRKDKLTPDELETKASKVRSAVTRMIGLIDTTLYAASLDSGKINLKLMPCNIRELVREICERQAEVSTFHEIEVEIDDLPGEIIADPARIDQVFTNLLSNAVKYAPDAPLIEVKAWLDGGNAVISVTDHGVGIPENELPQMFKRFFRAKTAEGIKGTGIGLSVVKEFVEMHGGNIDLASVEGEGSTFTVRLPIGNDGQ